MKLLTTFALNKLFKEGKLGKAHVTLFDTRFGEKRWYLRFKLKTGEIVGLVSKYDKFPYNRERYFMTCDTINLVIDFITDNLD